MKKRLFSFVWAALLLAAMVLPAGADMGPKPGVEVTLLGLEGRACWATLLSDIDGAGPHSAVKPGEPMDIPDGMGEQEIRAMEVFRAYAEGSSGGWWFIPPNVWDASDGAFSWGYYPPYTFRIALWFPQEEALAVSEPCERYAFDSYYTLDLTGADLEPGGAVTGLAAVRSYDYTWQILSLVLRILATIAVEMGVALLFRLRSRRQLAIILAVNIVTQVGLNVGLNWVAYADGPVSFTLSFAFGELAVTLLEMMAYSMKLPKLGELDGEHVGRTSLYALAANLASLAVGWWLANIIPGIF